jgi:RecG-like helicase
MTAQLALIRTDYVRPQERVSLAGTILKTETVRVGGSPVYRCVLADDWGELDLLFLGRATIAGLTSGIRCSIQGTVTVHRGRLAVWNPRYQVEP